MLQMQRQMLGLKGGGGACRREQRESRTDSGSRALETGPDWRMGMDGWLDASGLEACTLQSRERSSTTGPCAGSWTLRGDQKSTGYFWLAIPRLCGPACFDVCTTLLPKCHGSEHARGLRGTARLASASAATGILLGFSLPCQGGGSSAKQCRRVLREGSRPSNGAGTNPKRCCPTRAKWGRVSDEVPGVFCIGNCHHS